MRILTMVVTLLLVAWSLVEMLNGNVAEATFFMALAIFNKIDWPK